jgi:hypothetical protein
MKILFLSLILFCFFYFTMRYLKHPWEKRQLPPWSKYILGVFAWGSLLSFLGVLWGLAQPVIQLFTSPNMGLAFLIMGLALAVGAIAMYANANPELFDFASMKAFLKDSLAFANPARSWMLLAEEVDKHEVRRVYKEVTGKELPAEDERYDRELKKKLEATKGKEFFSGDKRVAASKELLAVLKQTIESPLAKEELQQLGQGAMVDISDSWHINRLKRSTHDYFLLVKTVTVDPGSKRMSFMLESEQFADGQVRDPVSLYRLKQNLYDFLQAVHQQDWVQPYLNHAATIVCTCSHFEDQAFIGIQVHQICRVEISRADLKLYENRYYDVGQMKTEVLI